MPRHRRLEFSPLWLARHASDIPSQAAGSWGAGRMFAVVVSGKNFLIEFNMLLENLTPRR
jgi:hypothetical protein